MLPLTESSDDHGRCSMSLARLALLTSILSLSETETERLRGEEVRETPLQGDAGRRKLLSPDVATVLLTTKTEKNYLSPSRDGEKAK